jgi:hypothetical protein
MVSHPVRVWSFVGRSRRVRPGRLSRAPGGSIGCSAWKLSLSELTRKVIKRFDQECLEKIDGHDHDDGG